MQNLIGYIENNSVVESSSYLHCKNTIMLLILWVLALTLIPSHQECSFKKSTIFCSTTDPANFLHDIFTLRITDDNFRFFYDLEITQSNFPQIYSFTLYRSIHFEKLVLTHSLIEFIEDYAFENYSALRVLSLSNNRLKTLSFVETLPNNLEELYLDGNHFTAVGKVFSRFRKLNVIDLSRCKITVVSNDAFASFFTILYINLSNNQLTSFEGLFKDGSIVYLYLSHNMLKSIDCHYSKITFAELNVSLNSLETVKGCNFDIARSVDFSFNNLNKESGLINVYNAYSLHLASCGITENFPFDQLATDKIVLNLSNNIIKTIKPLMFGNNVTINSLVLCNCSINAIGENAFYNFGNVKISNLLNISSNPITELRDYTFNKTRIETVDISNCLIKKIQDKAFSGLFSTKALNLSHNQITSLNNKVFQNLTEMKTLDLSHNILKKLNNDIFAKCGKLSVLDLSYSKIEAIRAGAFAGTKNLKELYLQNNFLDKIEFATFPLTILNLENNRISNLGFSFTENLSSNLLLLAGNDIGQLVNNSGSKMCCTRKIDASKSNIGKIEVDAFRGLSDLQMLNLRDNCLEKILPGTFLALKSLLQLDLRGNKLKYLSQNAFVFGNQLSILDITFFGEWKGDMLINLNYLETLNIVDSDLSLLDQNSFNGVFLLEKLNLHNTSISNVASGAFSGLDSLENINFQTGFKNLTVVKTKQFEGLQKLLNLDLSGLNITYLEPESFTGLTDLKILLLNNNKITKILNNTFLGLNSLKTLNISGNRISTLEIYAFYGLENLVELSLSDNNLTGPALGTFQNFPELRFLNLSKNNISYLLTGTFSNLKEVVKLDLSFNNITRLEVHDIISLRSLQHLDLTQNHLIQIEYLDLVKLLRQLKFIGINNNKWKCDDLVKMLAAFRKYNVDWVSSKSMTLLEENINGIKCFDICKFFYCV